MREIKFRGRREDIGWKYGYLTCIEHRELIDWAQKPAIRPFGESFITYGVDSETVGQYTGLKDSKNCEIYEGDILNIGEEGYAKAELVVFERGCFGINASWITYKNEDPFIELNRFCNAIFLGCVELIGNIYENPELLEGK